MHIQPEASIVRFFDTNGAVVGTGFVVSEGTVLTCAHVVAAALHLRDCPQETPALEVILDFPLIAAQQRLSAHVVFWQSPLPNGGGDIALLHLKDALLDGVNAARMVVTDGDLWGHDFRAFGFPNYHEQGVWASGKLRAREASGWVQIEDVKEAGYRVQPGFSGGAVWDEQLEGVAGMVVAAEEDVMIRAAYMIPTTVLVKAAPQLGDQTIPSCPYRGLAAFREQDAPYFFGRESFTQQVVEAVRRKPLLAVVGSSGSGKSSVVFAGLIPRLRNEGSWLITSFRPSNDPFRSLAAALLPLLEPQKSEIERLIESNKLARHLQQGELALQDVIEVIAQRLPGTRLLLMADQFEELYTLCPEQELREGFLEKLLTVVRVATAPDALNCSLVLTLRADFVGQALSYRPFADALQYADLKLGPMNSHELQDAIKKPAEKLHVRIEDGLTERILKEVSREPSHLPLLEFALTLLWAKQRERKLTNVAYEEIGGIEQALAKHAEEIYAGLNEGEQRRAQQIFLQLVRPGEGTEDTRRLATRAEVGEDNWELVARLSGWSARLVVTGRETTTGEETVEVIHEALIRGWQRLRDWMEEHREFRIWQERLRAALRQWERSRKDTGALLRGALLIEALKWQKQRPDAISPVEQAFIESSEVYQTQEAQRWKELYEEAEHQRQVAEQQREEARRQQWLAEEQRREADRQRLVAEAQKQEAEHQREEARKQQQIALARGLATQAELLHTQYPQLLERSVLLAIESLRRFHSPEADWAVRKGGTLLRRRLASLAHQKSVGAVAFSPDGRLLATASADNTAGVWEVSSGRRLASLAHQGSVNAVTFSPDGRLLATASADNTAGVWEVSSGRRLASLAHQNAVIRVAFSPDGRLLATASGHMTSWSRGSGSAEVWEVGSGRRMAILTHHHQGSVNAVMFSSDGRLLATASVDTSPPSGESGSAEVWEVSSGHRLATLAHQKSVGAVAFSPDGRLLATASADNTAGVWEVSSGQRVATLAHQNAAVVAFSSDGRLLAIASVDTSAWSRRLGSAEVWEVSSGHRLATLAYQDAAAVAFSSDRRLLAIAGISNTAGVWEVSSGLQLIHLTHEEPVSAVTFSPDGRLLATASADNTVGVWEVSSKHHVTSLTHERPVDAVTFSPDGRLLATTSVDTSAWSRRLAEVWEVSSGQRVTSLAHQGSVNVVTFSSDGRLLATASSGNTAGVWEVSSGLQLIHLTHEEPVSAVTFSPDGRLLATASYDNTARVWEVSSGLQLLRLPHEEPVSAVAFSPDERLLSSLAHQNAVIRVAFSPDGRLLATASGHITPWSGGSGSGSAEVWEVSSGRRMAILTQQGIKDMVFSVDGQLLATASADNTAGVWEVSSGHRVATLAHQNAVGDVAFSPDGRLLATASYDNTARVWEVSSGLQLLRLPHEEPVSAVAFSPDGRYLATVSGNAVKLWLYRREDLIADVQTRLNRNLTPEEWRQYLGDEPYRETVPHLP